jgi:hypothetical protein
LPTIYVTAAYPIWADALLCLKNLNRMALLVKKLEKTSSSTIDVELEVYWKKYVNPDRQVSTIGCYIKDLTEESA